jgi:HAMP domain-containing protein/HPt (histidine-containing phosphotransfer) domain-containing protein/two-component sensor histidine kinase
MLGSWLNSIKRRSFVAVGLIMILFAIMFASHYSLTSQSLNLLHSSESRTFPVLQLLDRSLTRLKDYQESLQAAVATNDEYAIDDAQLIGQEIEEHLRKVASLDPGLRKKVSPILEKFQDYRQISEDLTRRVIAKEINFSGEEPQIKSFFAIQEENFQRITSFRDEIHSFYIQEIRQISDSSETTISRGVILIIVNLLIASVILIFLQKSIIKPILALANASRKAALGEFSQVPQRQGQDEVSQLTNDFNQMIHSLDLSSHTMSSIIEHGRRMAVSSSLVKLRQALNDGLRAFHKNPLPHEFWVSLRTLVRGESVDRRFLLVSPEGELLSEACTLEELAKHAHIAVRNHHDDSTMAVIVCFEPNFDHSPVKQFLEAIAIHVASALDSIKLQDTMNLVKEQSQSMRTLLENIDQGICTIDATLNIRGPYSPFLETIVGVQGLEGVSFVESIIRKSTLNTEQKSILINILNVSFGEDIFVYEVNRHQLLRELEWWKNGQKVICEIDWIPLSNREGLTERFMIVLREVTHLRLLQKEAEANMKKLSLIDVLLHIEPNRFRMVTVDCQNTLLSIQESLVKQERSPAAWQLLRRNLHTAKGNLRALGLTNISKCLHEIEDSIESYLSSPAHDSGHEIINLEHQIRTARNELELVSELFYDTLKRGHAALTSTGAAQDQELLMWLEHVQRLPADQLMSELTLYRERIWKAAPYGSHMLVSKLEDAARKLSQDLGQKAPEILWIGSPLLLRSDAFNSILSALHHMLRNSLDHGFAAKKQLDQPTIRLEAAVHANGLLHLTYQDNGSGLNLKHLHAIASRMQLHLTNDDDALAELIFTQGVSVKDSVTEMSGRGIGMDAVRSTFKSLGGTIKVRFTAAESKAGYRSFAFAIELAAQDTLVWPLPNQRLHVA